MAELVDALDLGSSAERRESSSLSFRTIKLRYNILFLDELEYTLVSQKNRILFKLNLGYNYK